MSSAMIMPYLSNVTNLTVYVILILPPYTHVVENWTNAMFGEIQFMIGETEL